MSVATIPAAEIPDKPSALYGLRPSRRLLNVVGWGASGFALLLLSALLVWMLAVVLFRGAGAMSVALFTTVTRDNGGGLLNAIEGTFVLTIGAMVLAVPLGVAAGLYVCEFRHSHWASAISFVADVLVGVPSVVMGYFGYVTMVEWLGWNFSVAAGSIVLAIICLPYICRTTEFALGQISSELREAAYALGADERRVILRICLPAALPGISTGIMLALAVSVGETAPLIYTAGWSHAMWDGRLTQSPVAYLTYAVYTFITQPFAAANALAYAAAFLVTGFVLLVNVVGRFVLDRHRP